MKKPFVPKKYYKIYEEASKNKVLEVLLRFPEKEFSLSDLAKEAGVAKANIGGMLDKFQALELIKIEKLSKIWRIRANQDNWLFIRSKIVYNLNFIYQSGLVDFLVNYFNNPRAVVLFGSFRKGDDISKSDIDIAIEDDSLEEHKIVKLKELEEYEKQIGKEIQIHLFSRKNTDINVFNNIANGIVLYGFLEVSK